MTDPPASTRRLRLDISLPRPVRAHDFRHPAEADIPALGTLMWAAYQGTPAERDAGDGVTSATEEIRLAYNGAHGPFQPGASLSPTITATSWPPPW